MSNRFKIALLFGIGMAFMFCSMSFISILKGEDNTASEITRSFGAALLAGLIAGILAYLFSDRFNAGKIFGKKEDKFK